ncbi:hypothetical protein [Streptomyces sp. IMTB 2501]|uniref:hypothetical protein n=1 Tax=Streptomyces sp. IMTB 2501 TaxID=1776340 RepID=UPI00211701BD|nr:hypothetical protein [Streptomyces sp. IMTB 2501]
MTPKHLSGDYAQVTEELPAHDLPVTGTVPPEPSGWYLRKRPGRSRPRCGSGPPTRRPARSARSSATTAPASSRVSTTG